ncbi:MAG: purine-binding chemotaxis protein CheW [Gemmatimonadetes bacterium]|nr:purine-binding chemotaxis protein CheW [Gemmatimonadota bacterium]
MAGGRLFGCEISAVREIIPIRRATRLPGAPGFVVGLINLRGMVVTVVDLVRRFGGAGADPVDGSIIVVDFGTRAVGLAVDAMRDVQGVVARAVDTGSAATAGLPASVVRGMAESSEGLVTLLDIGAVLKQVMSSAEGES